MSEWKEYKLGDLTVDGKGHYGIAAPAVDYDSSKYTYLRITDINDDGTLNKQGLKSVDDSNAGRYLLKPNDIVFARTGASVGRSYFYDGNDGDLVYAGFLIKFSLDPNKVNPYMLKLYTHSQDYYDWIKAVDNGATRGNINALTFASMPIVLPSRDEQDKIVGVLGALDDKIDLLNRENATLEALAETLFRHYFIENQDPTWKEMPVSYYGKVICGKTPSKKNEEYYGGDVPFIKIPDMHGNMYVFNSEDTLSEKGKASQKEKTLPKESIMVSCIATVGLVSMNANEVQTNQQINSVVPYYEHYRYYLYCWFKSMYDELNTMASGGTATLNLNTGDFSRIGIPMPDEAKIKEFHLLVEPLFAKTKSNQQQMQTLAIQRDRLLPRLMSGEVKVVGQ